MRHISGTLPQAPRAEFAKVYIPEGKGHKLKTAPYKLWTEQKYLTTDLINRSYRKDMGRYGAAPPMDPPKIIYEQSVIDQINAHKEPLDMLSTEDLQKIHETALQITQRRSAHIPQSELANANQYRRDLASIEAGLEWENVMTEIKSLAQGARMQMPGEGHVGIIPREQNPAGRDRRTLNSSSRYSQYTSVDGKTYQYRTHAKLRTGYKLDVQNVLLHCFSELSKGGDPILPLAKAGVVLQDSTGEEVLNFTNQVAAEPESLDDIEPEVSIDPSVL